MDHAARIEAQLRMGDSEDEDDQDADEPEGRRCMSPTDDGDSETVQACPACDSSSVATNNIGGIQSVNPDADRYRCADCYETFDEPEERERRQDTFFRPDSLAAKLDAAEPDDLVTDGGVDRRRRIAIRGNPVWMDTPAGYEEWIDSLPSTFDLDDGFTGDRSRRREVRHAGPEA